MVMSGYGYTGVQVCLHVCICVCRGTRSALDVIPQEPLALFGFCLFVCLVLVRGHHRSTCFYFPDAEFTDMHHRPQVFMCVLRTGLGAYAYACAVIILLS